MGKRLTLGVQIIVSARFDPADLTEVECETIAIVDVRHLRCHFLLDSVKTGKLSLVSPRLHPRPPLRPPDTAVAAVDANKLRSLPYFGAIT